MDETRAGGETPPANGSKGGRSVVRDPGYGVDFTMGRVSDAAEAMAVRAALAAVRHMGPVAASNAMGALFRTLGPRLPVTRVADANLRAALPELDAAARRSVIRRMWDNLGRTVGEFPHLANLKQATPEGPGWEVVDDALLFEQARRGGPAIFVSGHISNWEVLPRATAAYGMPFSSVYRPAKNQGVNDVIRLLRNQAMGVEVPMFAKGSQGARDALAHLRAGGYLGMLVDQKMNDGIEARLFGLPAMTAPAVAALALRFRCPVIPGHVERVGPARFRLTVETPLHLPDSGNRQADVLSLTQALNDCLERWIRDRPESWLWLHRRFPRHVTQGG